MKRQALDHTKMDLLMRKLSLPRWGCVGILESLWHLTAREAPRGDIGRLSNERIAIGIDWRGAKNHDAKSEANRLIQALVEAGWIEVNDQWRLVIHDWHEHADDSVKKYLKRNGLSFACLDMSCTRSDMERLPVPVPEPLPEPVPVPVPEARACAQSTRAPIAVVRAMGSDFHARYEALYQSHPVAGFQQDGQLRYLELLSASLDAEAYANVLDQGHAAWCEFWAGNPTEFVPKIGKYFEDGYYLRKPKARDSPTQKLTPTQMALKRAREEEARNALGSQ